jgi:hypothetical protein
VVSLQRFAAKEDAARKYAICQGPNIHAHKKNLQVPQKVKELAAEGRSLLNSSSTFFLSFFHPQGSLTTHVMI